MKIQHILFLALLAASCSGSKMLQKSLSSYTGPIAYLHDSKISSSPKIDSLHVELNNGPLETVTSVSKLKGKVLPFIIFNYTESNMGVNLGQTSFQGNYDDFFYNSFLDESNRMGCFGISNKAPDDSVYNLEITIDTCRTYSQYQRSTTVLFMFFAYSMSFIEKGFPSETNLQVSTKLKRGNLLISEKTYTVKRTQPFLNSNQVAINKLRSDFTANMVESLSLSTKQCIEEIIDDLNTSISKNKSSLSTVSK